MVDTFVLKFSKAEKMSIAAQRSLSLSLSEKNQHNSAWVVLYNYIHKYLHVTLYIILYSILCRITNSLSAYSSPSFLSSLFKL